MMDHPDRYKGKVVEIIARAMKPKGFPPKSIMPGRMAMTCCADDTSFIGYLCDYEDAPSLKPGEWVKVRAKVTFRHVSVYRGRGPVLKAISVEPADPVPELVYFN